MWFTTVMAMDNVVWQCQTPETLEKSEKKNLVVLGRLGPPRIGENRGMISETVANQSCQLFTCEAEVHQYGIKMTWTDAKSKKEVQFSELSDSLTSSKGTGFMRKSSINICIVEDIDLVCKITSTSGDYRLSYPLRLVQL